MSESGKRVKNNKQPVQLAVEIEVYVSDSDEPGWLGRQRDLMVSFEAMTEVGDVKSLEDFVEVLLQYIVSPSDPDEAREMLYNQASKDDFFAIVQAIGGGSEAPLPASSVNGQDAGSEDKANKPPPSKS